MRQGHRTALLTALVAAGIAWFSPTEAADKPWYRYENSYFEAYSDARKGKVIRLLEELEEFRAAAAQFLAFDIPPDAPKTRLLIFRSVHDFRDITGSRYIGGFATRVNDVPTIVMPVGIASKWEKAVIRHEFVHILLSHSEHKFPPWYQEGLAEFMSSTQIKRRGSSFTIGDRLERRQLNGRGLKIPWDTLMSDDFAFHTAGHNLQVSNAYYQSWQLVHFLLIHDNFRYHKELGLFLGRYSAGEPTEAALQATLGMTANEVGALIDASYKGEVTRLHINFSEDSRDYEFSREKTDGVVVGNAIARLHGMRTGASN